MVRLAGLQKRILLIILPGILVAAIREITFENIPISVLNKGTIYG
jgi:hypothetical protein